MHAKSGHGVIYALATRDEELRWDEVQQGVSQEENQDQQIEFRYALDWYTEEMAEADMDDYGCDGGGTRHFRSPS